MDWFWINHVLISWKGCVHIVSFLLVSVFVASKLPVHIAPFLNKTVRKYPFLSVHIDLSDNENAAKTSIFMRLQCYGLRNSCWILERFQKPPFLCVQIDPECFQKPPFLWISTFDSIVKNLHFVVFLCRSVWILLQKRRFCSPFLYKIRAMLYSICEAGSCIQFRYEWQVNDEPE